MIAAGTRRAVAASYDLGRRFGWYDPGPEPIRYIAEKTDWVIRQDALSYARAIDGMHPRMLKVIDRPELATGRIAHFASQFMWQAWNDCLGHETKRLITFFHGKSEDGPEMKRHIDYFLDHLGQLERVVTAAGCIEARLLGWGVPRSKLIRVPLGIDLEIFRPPSSEEKSTARRKFGVPDGSYCIGSFQKDGTGWGEGMDPKWIKGPDIFTDAVVRLARHFPVFVLLTGPARGYVKKRLEASGIAYAHHNFSQASMVSSAYKALDLYIVASREEGGPKSVLESLASGVPLVSTRVGMAEDVIRSGINGYLVDKPDAALLAESAAYFLSSQELSRRLTSQGLLDIRSFSWDLVAERLYKEAYLPLLTAGQS